MRFRVGYPVNGEAEKRRVKPGVSIVTAGADVVECPFLACVIKPV